MARDTKGNKISQSVISGQLPGNYVVYIPPRLSKVTPTLSALVPVPLKNQLCLSTPIYPIRMAPFPSRAVWATHSFRQVPFGCLNFGWRMTSTLTRTVLGTCSSIKCGFNLFPTVGTRERGPMFLPPMRGQCQTGGTFAGTNFSPLCSSTRTVSSIGLPANLTRFSKCRHSESIIPN